MEIGEDFPRCIASTPSKKDQALSVEADWAFVLLGVSVGTLVHRKSVEFCWLDLHGVGERRFKTAFHRATILADLFL